MTKKNGNALNRKIFINSENPRGRRPVTCRIAGKDPKNDNNYHLHVTTCIYAIKPRQIINYDAGIVLIDLHQLNVKTTSDNTNQRHWIRGNLMSTKNRTRRTTIRNIRFPNQMIEQINIALEQKGSGNFSAWVIEACRRRLCSEKRVSPEANKEKSDITELLRKQVRPDWSNLDNRADYAPHITWKVLQWLRLPFLNKYSIKCEII